jgi:hypothetical protein
MTPVLIVESIEECLPFWVERLGFDKTAEVPHDGRLGFVILTSGTIELMLQTKASVREDVAEVAEEEYRTALFVEVDDLAAFQRALGDWPRVVDERETFYGMRETAVRDPAGNAVTFAQRIAG